MEKNVIDKALMSTVQWISLCAGLIIATNFVSLVLADIDRGRVKADYQVDVHIKDIEIVLHKMEARDKRNTANFEALWTEFNKLKENHKE